MAVRRKKAATSRSSQHSHPSSLSKSSFGLLTVLILALSFILALFRWANDDPIGLYHHVGSYVNWDARREEVKSAFITSWDAYFNNAWGWSIPKVW